MILPPRLTGLLATALFLGVTASVAAPAPAKTARPPVEPESSIVAVVNGDVISRGDVTARGRLFAVSTGLPVTPEVLDRLRPQITRQLINERLELQEAQRRHIIIGDKQIADSIREIESRNGMPAGALRAKLTADGVSLRTLIDQIRVQLGWTQVLRQQLGETANISKTAIDEQERALRSEVGRPEFRVAEIFIGVDNPAQRNDAERFAETVISELRSGAPFAVAAAQFSQSQTALSGGDLGWVQPNQLDPEVAQIVQQMPVGAISNPITVPGGISIVTLRAKREIGHDIGTILSLRQTFLPFASPLDPAHPTDAQREVLNRARSISASVHSCDAMEAMAKSVNSPRPADPGEVRLETINPPAFRTLLASLPSDRASQPLVSTDGIAVVIVCSREQKNVAALNREEIGNQLLGERIELASRQLLTTLRREASIDERKPASAAVGG
jgi:peptidyl-prolyl cis-trans isomerase SurA